MWRAHHLGPEFRQLSTGKKHTVRVNFFEKKIIFHEKGDEIRAFDGIQYSTVNKTLQTFFTIFCYPCNENESYPKTGRLLCKKGTGTGKLLVTFSPRCSKLVLNKQKFGSMIVQYRTYRYVATTVPVATGICQIKLQISKLAIGTLSVTTVTVPYWYRYKLNLK
jgi:hypothetical protein